MPEPSTSQSGSELADLTGHTWKDSPTLNLPPEPEPQWICGICGCGQEIGGEQVDHSICHGIATNLGHFGPIGRVQ